MLYFDLHLKGKSLLKRFYQKKFEAADHVCSVLMYDSILLWYHKCVYLSNVEINTSLCIYVSDIGLCLHACILIQRISSSCMSIISCAGTHCFLFIDVPVSLSSKRICSHALSLQD